MSADEPTAKGFSLKRWSQRKLEAARATREPMPAPAAVPAPPPAEASITPPVAAPASDAAAPASDVAALPPVESLTIDSDFTAFLQPKVDETLKRQALKQLFRDPRFNVMDGLDVYVDDYSIPDPISPDIVKQLVQGRYIFDPPATRVNERGEVEDVPPDEVAAKPADAEPAPLAEAEPDAGMAAVPGESPQAVPAASASAATGAARMSADAPSLGALPAQADSHDTAVPAQPGPPGSAPR